MIMVRALEVVRLTVEVVAVALVAAWGLQVTSGPTRWLVALAATLALSLIWGRYVAPKSPNRLADPARLAVEVALFIAVAFAAAPVLSPAFGTGFGVVAIGDALALRVSQARARDGSQDRAA